MFLTSIWEFAQICSIIFLSSVSDMQQVAEKPLCILSLDQYPINKKRPKHLRNNFSLPCVTVCDNICSIAGCVLLIWKKIQK